VPRLKYVQVPLLPLKLQDLQSVVLPEPHDVSQHRPSTQKPEAHCEEEEQDVPLLAPPEPEPPPPVLPVLPVPVVPAQPLGSTSQARVLTLPITFESDLFAAIRSAFAAKALARSRARHASSE
jgi:hypothetical protein